MCGSQKRLDVRIKVVVSGSVRTTDANTPVHLHLNQSQRVHVHVPDMRPVPHVQPLPLIAIERVLSGLCSPAAATQPIALIAIERVLSGLCSPAAATQPIALIAIERVPSCVALQPQHNPSQHVLIQHTVKHQHRACRTRRHAPPCHKRTHVVARTSKGSKERVLDMRRC